MSEHYDSLETRDPAAREQALFAALPAQIAHAKQNAPGFSRILADFDPQAITTRVALARLPVTRKSDLGELQKRQPPLGGLNATPLNQLAKIFVSPGPVYEPEGAAPDWWRTARALGCTVVPSGIGQTEMQVSTIADLRISAFIGTPSFLKLIVEKADELKADLGNLKKAMVGGEYLPPALRKSLGERGIRVMQSYGTADLGSLAYESALADGSITEGMILDEGLLLEIVRPGTGDPVAPGEVGEVVITTFNPDYPLVRFGTGDLSAVLPRGSPCGRTNVRIKGWMGRADQTTKVRGMFVTPKQVGEILRRHPEVLKARLVVAGTTGNDNMTLRCEGTGEAAGLKAALIASIRDVTKLRGEIEIVPAGSLPNDGKVIDDTRKYD